jgi:prepilin-type N-terminal cleavage/methylation domain-containing protein
MPRLIAERLQRDESGFTLIELLVAAALCSVGLMAVISTFDGSRELVSEAERNEVASHRAQRALEETIARPYSTLALQGTTVPPRSTDPNHPSNRVTTSGRYEYRRSPSQTAAFVMAGAVPHTSPWSDPQTRLSGTIYRYVTEYRDTALDATGNTVHGKRVTVAVSVADRRRPVTLTTIVRDGGN